MLGGTTDARQFIQKEEKNWKWGKTANSDENRPWAAITVLKPTDSLEVSHPEKGVNIRIRPWLNGVRQTINDPQVSLTQLKLDQTVVNPETINKKDNRGALSDTFYLYALPNITEGKHIVQATFKSLKDNRTRTIVQRFVYAK